MTLHTFSNIVCLGLERTLAEGEDATEGAIKLYSVRHGQLHEECHHDTNGPVYDILTVDSTTVVTCNGNHVSLWRCIMSEVDIQLSLMAEGVVPGAALCADFHGNFIAVGDAIKAACVFMYSDHLSLIA